MTIDTPVSNVDVQGKSSQIVTKSGCQTYGLGVGSLQLIEDGSSARTSAPHRTERRLSQALSSDMQAGLPSCSGGEFWTYYSSMTPASVEGKMPCRHGCPHYKLKAQISPQHPDLKPHNLAGLQV